MKSSGMTKTRKKTALQRPFVLSNFAMTADGKIAFADHSFTPFGSRRDREHMFELRATADAVICGARTIEDSGAVLGIGHERFRRLRLKRGLQAHHLRVIISGSGSINPDATIFKKRFSPIIVLTTNRISKTALKKLQAVADEVKICGEREINFTAAFRWLWKKYGIRRLLCEGGGELHDALLRDSLVDELHLTFCEKIFGGKNAPTLADGLGFKHLAQSAHFKLISLKRKDTELFTIFKAQNSTHANAKQR